MPIPQFSLANNWPLLKSLMQMSNNLIKLSYLYKKKPLSSHEAGKFLFRLRTASWAKNLWWKCSFGSFSVSHFPGKYQSFHSRFTIIWHIISVISQSFHYRFTVIYLIFVCFFISCNFWTASFSFVFFFCAACLLCKPDRPTTDDTN